MREGKPPTRLVKKGAPLRRKLCPRTWSLNLRTWIIGFTCIDFMTTYVDGGLGIVLDGFFRLDGKKSCACL